jgi:hypothetical protein
MSGLTLGQATKESNLPNGHALVWGRLSRIISGVAPDETPASQAPARLERDLVRRAIARLSDALVVDLGRRHVLVAQQRLHVDDVDALRQEQGSGGGPQGVGRVV